MCKSLKNKQVIMNRIYTLAIAFFATCLLGCFSSSKLFAQSLDEEKIVPSQEKETTRSVNLSLHLRTAYHSDFAGEHMKYIDGNFRLDHVILGIDGHITPKLSYKYQQRLNKVSPIFTRENLPATIDYAYLRYDFNEHFALTAGKQALSVGGFEYYKYPVDVYDFSGISNNLTCYLTGLQAAYKPTKTQELTFQVLNNRLGAWEDAVGLPQYGLMLEKPATPFYFSLGWNSSYFNEALQLRYAVNYTSPAKGKSLFMISGGQKWQSRKFSIYVDALYQLSDIDYLGGIRKLTSTPENMVEHVSYFTLLTELNWRFNPKWNLLMKGYYDSFSTTAATNFLFEGSCLTSLNGQAGIEFYPMKDDNLHLFFVTTLKNYLKPEVIGVTKPENSFRVSLGVTYRIPVLSLKR